MSHRIVRWRDWSGEGLEHLSLTTGPGAVVAEAVVVAPGPPPFAAEYRIELDDAWRTRRLAARVIGVAESLDLRSDGDGAWRTGAGARLEEMAGALDVDLAITPFTNTLPIRRLALAVGESADIDPLYLTFPDLTLRRDPQRYTRLAERTYRYASRDSDYQRDIAVDGDGIVTVYPGLFRRIL